MTNAFIVHQTNTFSAGEERSALVTNATVLETNALKTRVQTSIPQSYTRSYQRLSNRTSLEIATHRYYSPSKTGAGGSHALVLTCEYATPPSFYTQRHSLLD